MKGLPRLLAVGLLSALLVLVLGVSLVQAKDPARSGSVVVGPGQSIQAAVNHAKPGSAIIVRGIHHETVVVHKDGIRLVGKGAVIKPPKKPSRLCPPSGFCVIGTQNSSTGKVSRYVKNVTITGFTIRNFKNFGIVALGARNATFIKNRAFNNDEYGITAFSSIGTRMISNTTSGSTEEAGLYVGDSPHANATVVGNNSYGNEFGLLVRNATHGRIAGNNFHNNCLGTVFVADAPGPAGAFTMVGNQLRNNTHVCPAHEEIPPVSGVGVAILGGHDVSITGNTITGNVAHGPSIAKGGVVVARGLGGTPPKNNSVIGNTILHNKPDIFWDKSGSGNRFIGNRCNTSVPGNLCGM